MTATIEKYCKCKRDFISDLFNTLKIHSVNLSFLKI